VGIIYYKMHSKSVK